MKINKVGHILCAFAAVYFIIALPTYLLGCEKNDDNSCIVYDKYEGSVIGYKTTEHTCCCGRKNYYS